MRYAIVFASSFFLVSTVALALLLGPDLWRDFNLRGNTIYAAKNYKFENVKCRSLEIVSLCKLVVNKIGTTDNHTFEYLIYGQPGRVKLEVRQSRTGKITTNFGRLKFKNRVITFAATSAVFLGLMLFCFLSLWVKIPTRKKKKAKRYNEDQLQHLADRIRVPDNPVEVWQNIMQGSELNWIVCGRGSLVLWEDERQPPEHAAWRALDEVAYTAPSQVHEECAAYVNPDYAVWIVSYPGSSILNYVKLSDTCDEDDAVRIGQDCRARDAYEKRILYVERGMQWMRQ